MVITILTIISLLGAADQADPNLTRARELFNEGQRLYAAGNFPEAVKSLRASYELTESPDLAYNVAKVCERMAEYREAIKYYRIYLRRGKPSAQERANLEKRIDEIESADKRRREQLFASAPTATELTEEARAFFTRGVAMFKRRKYPAAMQAFNAALRFAPLPEIYYNMAITAERQGTTRDAVDYYREYLRMRPDAPDVEFVKREIERLRASRDR